MGVAGTAFVGGTAKIVGVTTHGDDVVSDTDSTDDLGTTGVRWANLFVDGITATDQITATGFTGTLDGILGSGTPAAATVTQLTSGGVIVSDTDSTDDLGTTGVRWANLFVDGITATDQITATGFTGTLDGILGSGTPAAATVTNLLIGDGGTVGAASSTSAITIASSGIVSFIDDVKIKDGGTIGTATTPAAVTVAAGGNITTSGTVTTSDGTTIGLGKAVAVALLF